jgi:hypothetical protein
MDGAGRPREIPLKAKYRAGKPKGKYRADYMGNSGLSRHKHVQVPAIHGIRRKRHRRKI